MDIFDGSPILSEEFDYQALLAALNGYARPRDRITELIRKGEIIRVKKGIYVPGAKRRRRPFSREVLANLIYGPSYISLEYALAFGLRVLQHRFGMGTHGGTSSESGGQPPHSRRFATSEPN